MPPCLQEHVKSQIEIQPETNYRGYQRLGANVTRYDGGFARDFHEAIDLYREVDARQLQVRLTCATSQDAGEVCLLPLPTQRGQGMLAPAVLPFRDALPDWGSAHSAHQLPVRSRAPAGQTCWVAQQAGLGHEPLEGALLSEAGWVSSLHNEGC